MDLPDRLHPNRLQDGDYHVPGATVFVTWRAQTGVRITDQRARTVISVMGRMARNRAIHIEAYCIMPDHVHALVSLNEDGDIRGWVRYVKREAARRCEVPGMWQRSDWDRHARKTEDVWGMVAYVLNNPVRLGLVSEWHQWHHSWADGHDDARGANPNAK